MSDKEFITKLKETLMSNRREIEMAVSKCASMDILAAISLVLDKGMREIKMEDTAEKGYISNPFIATQVICWITTGHQNGVSPDVSIDRCNFYLSISAEGTEHYRRLKAVDMLPEEDAMEFYVCLSTAVNKRRDRVCGCLLS